MRCVVMKEPDDECMKLNTFLKRTGRRFLTFLTLSALSATAAGSVKAQDQDTTRKLWDTAFIEAGKQKAQPRKSVAKRSYHVATPGIPPVNVAGDTPVGITLWRLRPAAARDTGERILEQEGANAVEWIPERVSLDANLSEGDRVRLSVEAARNGYLYVIDREQYADGTMSEPYLIFPTTRTLGGKNEVSAGKIIEIPGQDDSPPFFTLKPSSSKQTGEVLSILVTPTPIAELQISDKAQKLSDEQVARFEKLWGANVGRLEMDHSATQAWTKEEKEAADGAHLLTANAPRPQTLFYRPRAKSNEPLLVKVELKYRRSTPPRVMRNARP